MTFDERAVLHRVVCLVVRKLGVASRVTDAIYLTLAAVEVFSQDLAGLDSLDC